MNFENLTVILHVLYILNTQVKFRSNRILFTIQSINIFFKLNVLPKNFKFKHVIDDITIDFSIFFFKFCKLEAYNKNVQFNSYIFKIYTQ